MGLGILLAMSALLVVLGVGLLMDYRGVATLLAARSARRQAGWPRILRILNPRGLWVWKLTGAEVVLVGFGIAIFSLLNPPT